MNFSEVLKALNSASTFELYRVAYALLHRVPKHDPHRA